MIEIGHATAGGLHTATIRIPVLTVLTASSLRRLSDATPGAIENTPTDGRVYLVLETAPGNILRCVARIDQVDAIRNAIRQQLAL